MEKYLRLLSGTAVAGYDPAAREYTLAFTNNEVKFGFLESLMPEYVSDCGSGSGIDVFTLRRYISRGDPESIRNVLTALFARITYANASNANGMISSERKRRHYRD